MVFGIVFSSLLALLGVALVLAGRRLIRNRGQRIIGGSQPHCMNCDYLLVRLQSDRCPECGTLLTEKNIVHGERSNGTISLIGGTIAMLIGLRMMVPLPVAVFESIPWYHFRPVSWVLADLKTGTPGIQENAVRELERRYDGGSLSPDIRDQAIVYALTQQAVAAPTRLTSLLVDYLGRHWAAGEMADAQKTAFFRQLVRIKLIAHRQIAAGDAVSCVQDYTFWSPSADRKKDFWVMLFNPVATIDGSQVHLIKQGGGSVNGVGSTGRSELSMHAQDLGSHSIQITQPINVFEGEFMGGPHHRTLLYHEDRKLQASIQVLADPPPNLIKLNNDPALAGAIRACMKPGRFQYYRHSEHSFHVEMDMEFEKLPANIAFDVIAHFNGKEYLLSPLKELQGMAGGEEPSGDLTVDSLPAACDLILRANPKIARETGDMNEIWNGQIVLPDVPLVPVKP